MDKYNKGVLVIALLSPVAAVVAGTMFPEPSELTPVSSFIIAMVSVFYMGMIIGIKTRDDKK